MVLPPISSFDWLSRKVLDNYLQNFCPVSVKIGINK
jgi:hypothetical protein